MNRTVLAFRNLLIRVDDVTITHSLTCLIGSGPAASLDYQPQQAFRVSSLIA